MPVERDEPAEPLEARAGGVEVVEDEVLARRDAAAAVAISWKMFVFLNGTGALIHDVVLIAMCVS